MDAINGIDKGNTLTRKKKFDLFRPVSVKSDGKRIESQNWCVRFQHKGKRTCRSLGTADYRLAQQRAKLLVASVRQNGWAGAAELPTSHGSLSITDLLEHYHRSAVSRGLRPRSIAHALKDMRRVTREIGARRLADLTPQTLQSWIEGCRLKPITLRAILKNAGSVFSRPSLQAMAMTELTNPFARLIRPKIDREPFQSPPREWIIKLMRQGIKDLKGSVRLAFLLALGAGLRWGEIISLTWENVRKDSVTVLASKAKGRRARVVPVSKLVQGVLSSARSEGIVINADAKQVHQDLCNWLIKRGIKDQKPVHYLRKCFGSLAVGDHGIFIASKLLGHSNITLTASTYAGQVDKLPAVKF
jgi:integrase